GDSEGKNGKNEPIAPAAEYEMCDPLLPRGPGWIDRAAESRGEAVSSTETSAPKSSVVLPVQRTLTHARKIHGRDESTTRADQHWPAHPCSRLDQSGSHDSATRRRTRTLVRRVVH